ncbi:MAG: hypothetical protein ABSH35_15455 [Isosphaeraceae bacterium]
MRALPCPTILIGPYLLRKQPGPFPHIAGTDLQSMSDMAELAARTVVELYHNRWPAACVVNGDVRLGWRW